MSTVKRTVIQATHITSDFDGDITTGEADMWCFTCFQFWNPAACTLFHCSALT